MTTFLIFAAPDNNPGWYLPEDDGTGGVAIQRRNMPLLKDNSSVFSLNQKTKVVLDVYGIDHKLLLFVGVGSFMVFVFACFRSIALFLFLSAPIPFQVYTITTILFGYFAVVENAQVT